jgi:spore cortex formation protein SpoVR/YcgB (stage V sporulation)
MPDMPIDTSPLFEGSDWDYARLQVVYDAIERVAFDELGLDIYPNRIEVITFEQMLDAYASIGMPLMYNHWSFGKHFARDELLYRKGMRGLAYEIVINSDPCLSYVMEENSMTMQALVLSHAAFGHNHFFKNNHLFRQWTDAEGILDYLEFAKSFIAHCEERYGALQVEAVLDAAHALMSFGVHRYPKKRPLNFKEERRREMERLAYEEQIYNDLWRTVPGRARRRKREDQDAAGRRKKLLLPEENILYFLEKSAPRLEPWQREILRIVRCISQYFYPQKQTKVMNEGCATAVHYYIMNRLHESGQLTDSAMMEFLVSHTNVVTQPAFDDQRYSGINPYYLGFEMMQDIRRMCTEPTEEDRRWFPDIAGNGDPNGTLRHAWANFRDESFILQFLSPHLIRKMRLFQLRDDAAEPNLLVDAIHDDRGYASIRRALARQYDIALLEPDIQVVDVDMAGDRRLMLQHNVVDGILLDELDTRAVLRHIAELWGYEVKLIEVDAASEAMLNEYPSVAPRGRILGR